MRKTLFAGLTVLNPDESVTSDNGAFIGRDRDTIDRLLEIGAKTHRHNGLDGLGNPVSPMGASAISSGGTIGANQTFSLAYTLEDGEGGETLLAPIVTFSTPPPINPPFLAPNGEAEYENNGDLPVDTYYYAFSFIDGGGGETPIGPARAVERQPGFEEAKVNLSGFTAAMSSAAGAVGWRLYRAVGGGDFGYLSSGTGDSYVDDGSAQANCDITPLADEINTTNGDNSFEIALPSADAFVAEGEFINVYMTNSSDFIGDALLEQFPLSSAGQRSLYRSVQLLFGEPPDVNSSIGGAHKIDPDTELLDWHWKRPVTSVGDLPLDAEHGDVRIVLDEDVAYEFTSDDRWEPLAGSGGGGSSGSSGCCQDFAASGGVLATDDFATLGSEWEEIELIAGFPDEADFVIVGGRLAPNLHIIDEFNWDGPGGGLYNSDVIANNGRSKFRFTLTEDPTNDYDFWQVGSIIKWIDEDNYLEFYVFGPDGFYTLEGRGNGNIISLEFDDLADLREDTNYWIVTEINGAEVIAQLWSSDPDLGGRPDIDLSHTLDILDNDERVLIDAYAFPALDCQVELLGGVTEGPQGALIDDWSFVYRYVEAPPTVYFKGSSGIGIDVSETPDGDALIEIFESGFEGGWNNMEDDLTGNWLILGGAVPRWRINGRRVEFIGGIESGDAEEIFYTLPVGARPSETITLNGMSGPITVSTGGAMVAHTTEDILFHGQWFPLEDLP